MTRKKDFGKKRGFMFVYILTNKTNSVLYIGTTNDIRRRLSEHREGIAEGFAKKYNATKPVYCEEIKNPHDAIQREKQLKRWSRQKKIHLIESLNPEWNDLSELFY